MLTSGAWSSPVGSSDNITGSAIPSATPSSPSLFNESSIATLDFFIYSNDSHVIYHWPQLNYTVADNDFEAYNYVYDLASNSTGSASDDGDDSDDDDGSDDSYTLSKRATNCLNRNHRFKRTGCSGCGKEKGYKSGHNCKNAHHKGYSCLESCSKHGHGIGCTESCGAVASFIGYEHGVCWGSKCTREVLHDEL